MNSFEKRLIKSVLLLSFLILGANFVQGQNLYPGVKVGLNLNHLRGDVESSYTPSYNLALVYFYRASDQLDIHAELGINGRNNKVETWENSDLTGESTKQTLKLSSISGAVIANYYLIAPTISLQGGVYYGFNRYNDKSNDLDGRYSGVVGEEDSAYLLGRLGSSLNTFDAGLVAGVAYGGEAYRISLRYNHSLLNLFGENFSVSNDTIPNVKYSGLELSFSYYFLDF